MIFTTEYTFIKFISKLINLVILYTKYNFIILFRFILEL